MKFICVKCNEPMKLEEAAGPDEGSMSVTFGCPKCGNRITLLTNPGETQLVKALDVRIGGREASPGPMELVRDALTRQRNQSFVQQTADAQPEKAVIWTDEARKRLQNVPAFARDMARKTIEQYAREEGYCEITPDVMKRTWEKSGS